MNSQKYLKYHLSGAFRIPEDDTNFYESLREGNTVTIDDKNFSRLLKFKMVTGYYYIDPNDVSKYHVRINNDTRRRLLRNKKEALDAGREVLRRLKVHGIINPEDFLDTIYSTKSFISGSFMMQVYLNVNWDDSDIDVFTGQLDWVNKLKQLYSWKVKENNEKYEAMVLDFVTPSGKVLQVIYRKDLTAIEVLESFDLSFCQIGFNGKEMIMSSVARTALDNYSGTYTLSIGDRPISQKIRERLQKYEKRGFTIRNKSQLRFQ